jgi:deoxyribodipyrimidine photo-lyase
MSFSAFWFRRDLRLEDNVGLSKALQGKEPVIPIFIFDKSIFSKLNNPKDSRVDFIYQRISNLRNELISLGSDLIILYGEAEECWRFLLGKYQISNVYLNRDYESYAIQRDEKIRKLCASYNVGFHTSKDQVIFEKDEILKEDGTPYVVFTSFKNKFIAKLQQDVTELSESIYLKSHSCKLNNFFKPKESMKLPSLEELGFQSSNMHFPDSSVDEYLIQHYTENRDYPAKAGTSKLGVHLRFGTISIRKLFRTAANLNATFLSELIWRDFYSMILQSFPHVEFSSFKKQYDHIRWENDEEQFKAWCNGLTGYPMVDAGMRELNKTGYMHNRLRMITASFLVKHLLIDWRWGEAYFAEKLLDYELASNNGGWQWAAGCGTDAAPYFRIFNPQKQQERFDTSFEYIKQWVPEYNSSSYPKPIIEHAFARERCLRVFKDALKPGIDG